VQTRNKDGRQHRGGIAHKGAQTNAVIKFLSVLTTHTGATCNQPVELAKDWKSDCLEKQNLLVVEICGVLGRLHSNQGLSQSNNNAKLNKYAKTYKSCWRLGKPRQMQERGKGGEKVQQTTVLQIFN
jgi:hypothetical protein